jgi:H+-translocating NAD(P) transhydrogenase subunit alpha
VSGWSALYIFMLAAFTGYVIIGAVPVILHTPLMSGANFVHGIVLVGAMVTLGFARGTLEVAIGVFAVTLAAMNVHGGYVVTVRMLAMFKSSHDRPAARRRGSGDGDAVAEGTSGASGPDSGAHGPDAGAPGPDTAGAPGPAAPPRP